MLAERRGRGRRICFEVFRVRPARAGSFGGPDFVPEERWPAPSAWGKEGLSVVDEGRARWILEHAAELGFGKISRRRPGPPARK